MTEKTQQDAQNNDGRQSGHGRADDGTLANPGHLDFKKADKVFEKIVRENQEWLKEMASR